MSHSAIFFCLCWAKIQSYYDMFLKKYKELASKRNWKQPLLVALSYSLQIVDEGAITIRHNDVPVDAIVSPAGFIPTSPAATKMSD
ncbi:5-formyltetrahydrofolate cyclo-ligase, mitochondrial-like isoform X2 [Camellia sinensis]|uniref:5-formyltetrahydrofolate cyclo-ligase, mitochondrial-like isoform X2 n=1 Tax=Camellia sinensis TaxID=4442 RepID=UPI001036C604|nr:5-formyltetrahydrofolate cyclo-ligase, mitochondrial-like isoform X2 [Camellia sinensis]